MPENSREKTPIDLYKNIVKAKQNVGAMVEALKDAFEIDPKAAIDWYKEISKQREHYAGWYFQNTMFDLLTKIVEIDRQNASEIFFNLLDPQFDEYPPMLPDEQTSRIPRRESMDLWKANEILPKLFPKGPKEFTKTILELVLVYRDILKQPKKKGIQDVFYSIWYHDDPIYEEIKLLKYIENTSCDWAEKNDGRVDEVIQCLEKEQYSIARDILIKILLANPTKYVSKLFELMNSEEILSSYDTLHLLPMVLHVIGSNLSNDKIEKINKTFSVIPLPDEIKPEYERSYRKYLLSSIPEKYLNETNKKTLQDLIDVETLHPRGELGPPVVYTDFQEKKEMEDKKFDDLTEIDQESEINRLVSIYDQFNTKDAKLDFLKNVEVYLNKDRKKIKKETIIKLKPIVAKLCEDPDPEDDFGLTKDKAGHSLISYPTIRASAASCQMRLTWHDPEENNIFLCMKMANDENTLVREEVARNLRYLSVVDFKTSLDIAQKFQKDNIRVLFFLVDYVRFILPLHPDESFEMCKDMIERLTTEKTEEEKNSIIEYLVSLVVFMALKYKNSEFTSYFEKLLLYESYDSTIKHTIAFTCKNEDIIFDESLKPKVLEIYHILLQNKNKKIRDDADFFLLHTLTDKNKSFWPDIKPLLETMSSMKYDARPDDFMQMNIINYIEKFWNQIPEESAEYLSRIYVNNPHLTHSFHRGPHVIKMLDAMLESMQFSDTSRKKLIDVLMGFVKTGWPEAIELLKKLESKS